MNDPNSNFERLDSAKQFAWTLFQMGILLANCQVAWSSITWRKRLARAITRIGNATLVRMKGSRIDQVIIPNLDQGSRKGLVREKKHQQRQNHE